MNKIKDNFAYIIIYCSRVIRLFENRFPAVQPVVNIENEFSRLSIRYAQGSLDIFFREKQISMIKI